MSAYGSVQQFKERIKEAIDIHGAFVVSVSCLACVTTRNVCAECKPEQEAWVDRALVGLDHKDVSAVPPQELLKAVRS